MTREELLSEKARMEAGGMAYDTYGASDEKGANILCVFLTGAALEALDRCEGRVECRDGQIVFVQDCRGEQKPV